MRIDFHKQSKFHSVVFPNRALSELVPGNFFVSTDTEKCTAKMHGATPSNLAQGGLISSNATFSYPRAGARCTRAIWDANGSHQIFSNGRELDLLVVSHENTVEFAALTITFVLLCCDYVVDCPYACCMTSRHNVVMPHGITSRRDVTPPL
jgi:hypothetical protein